MPKVLVEKGKTYQFIHKRKGAFVAQVIGLPPADPLDEKDDYFIEVQYDVREGTDQFRLRTGSRYTPDADIRVSRLRPSLLREIKPISDEVGWKRELPESRKEPPPPPPKSLKDKIRESLRNFISE